jgi:hypothetical protein
LATSPWTPILPRRAAHTVLRYVAAAIRHAAITAPDRWGLTPHPNGVIRLNVGWCEVITAGEDEITLIVTLAAAPSAVAGHSLSFKQRRGRPYFYQRSPGSAEVVIPLKSGLPLGRILNALQPALFRNIAVAARAGLGRGVKEGHQDSAVRSIAARLGERLPVPHRTTGANRHSVSTRRFPMGSADFFEGTAQRAAIVRLERSRAARRACIARHGSACCACGFDFGATYRRLGAGFIIVHHLYPLGESRGRRRVDAFEHLRPVCANCHYMLHTEDPPLGIGELRDILVARGSKPNNAIETGAKGARGSSRQR